MPDYIYTAKNESGTDTTGRITANSKREALEAIHRLKLFPLRIEDSRKGEITIKLFERRVADMQIAVALTQLADLLENGVPILQAFQVLDKQTPNPRLKSVIKNIHDRIADGESIDSAFAAHSNVFGDLTVSIIRAGAEGAFLEDALRRVGGFLEQQDEIKGRVTVALFYPVILASFGTIIFCAILIFFIPLLKELFEMVEAEGHSLPWITQSLFWMREILLGYGLYVIGAVLFLFLWIQGQLSTAWGTRIWDRFKIRLPLVGNILLDSAVARFCRVLGTLLENGVPILKSLEISGQSTGNSLLADAVRRSAENVSSGATLAKPLSVAGIIPPQVMAMISVAEESNTLESVLVNAADAIERRTARKLEMLVGLIGPLMLLIMGLVLFYIVAAVLYPIFLMWSGFVFV
jgi:general secretion pathway protein F/type IV pilus assembly protein PilC